MKLRAQILLVVLVSFVVVAQTESIQEEQSLLHIYPRNLYHYHLETSPLYGNITDLEYFYTNVYVGSHMQKQSLIVNTGSSQVVFPCANHCLSCPDFHLENFYEMEKSEFYHIHSCFESSSCSCTNNNYCQFNQRFGEGSQYSGFFVEDKFYLGEDFLQDRTSQDSHPEEHGFNLTFGCVLKETKYLFSQKANGVLGLQNKKTTSFQEPIFEALYNQNLTERKMFALCLGKNGGYFQLGGYDGRHQLENVSWSPMHHSSKYTIQIEGISLNGQYLISSLGSKRADIESGTTYTYFPQAVYNAVSKEMDAFCAKDPINHCKGKRVQGLGICFYYSEKDYQLKDYFLSYPILEFHARGMTPDKPVTLKWFPSEYLFRQSANQLCLAADPDPFLSDILIGGSLMRQNNFIFDIEENKVGFARAQCSEDPNQILSENELTYGSSTRESTSSPSRSSSSPSSNISVNQTVAVEESRASPFSQSLSITENYVNEKRTPTKARRTIEVPVFYLYWIAAVVILGLATLIVLMLYLKCFKKKSQQTLPLPNSVDPSHKDTAWAEPQILHSEEDETLGSGKYQLQEDLSEREKGSTFGYQEQINETIEDEEIQ